MGLIIAAIIVFLLLSKPSVVGRPGAAQTAQPVGGSGWVINTPWGSARGTVQGLNPMIPQAADILASLFAQPQPTVDPSATYVQDSLAPIDPEGASYGALDAATSVIDPTLDPSNGTDPFSAAAYDPSGGGTVVGAF